MFHKTKQTVVDWFTCGQTVFSCLTGWLLARICCKWNRLCLNSQKSVYARLSRVIRSDANVIAAVGQSSQTAALLPDWCCHFGILWVIRFAAPLAPALLCLWNFLYLLFKKCLSPLCPLFLAPTDMSHKLIQNLFFFQMFHL